MKGVLSLQRSWVCRGQVASLSLSPVSQLGPGPGRGAPRALPWQWSLQELPRGDAGNFRPHAKPAQLSINTSLYKMLLQSSTISVHASSLPPCTNYVTALQRATHRNTDRYCPAARVQPSLPAVIQPTSVPCVRFHRQQGRAREFTGLGTGHWLSTPRHQL